MTALDVGEIAAGLKLPTNEKERYNRDENVDDGEKITGKTFGAHFHDFDAGDDVKWKSECEFAGAGKSAEHKGVGSGLDGFGAKIKSFGIFARDEQLRARTTTVIKEKTKNAECGENASKSPEENGGFGVEIVEEENAGEIKNR